MNSKKLRVTEPFVFYVILFFILYWSFTTPPWPRLYRMVFLYVYMPVVPLISTKLYRKEKVIVKLGIKEHLLVPWQVYLGLFFTFSIYTIAYAYCLHWEMISFITTVLLAPLTEELFYRAYMLGSLRTEDSNLKREIIIITATAFCFSIIHMIQPAMGGRDVGYIVILIVNSFIFGIICGEIFLHLKNIIITVLFHGIWNAWAVLQNVFLGIPELIFICFALCTLILIILDFFKKYEHKIMQKLS